MNLSLHPYQPADFIACMIIMKSNIPKFFLQEELKDFEQYLTRMVKFNLDCPYWVVKNADEVIGCGGVGPSLLDSNRIVLIWGMVDRRFHHKGVGKLLTMHRLEYARKQWPEQAVSIDTSQHTTGFYQHLGFKVIEWKKDGYGPGLDRVELIWKPD